MKGPFHPSSTLTLCRLTIQADPLTNKAMHVSCGYLTRPPSGGPAVYRERWLQDLDGHSAARATIASAWFLVQANDRDFVDVALALRCVMVDLDARGRSVAINVVYDIRAPGFELQRRVALGLVADSFWNRALSVLLDAALAKMA